MITHLLQVAVFFRLCNYVYCWFRHARNAANCMQKMYWKKYAVTKKYHKNLWRSTPFKTFQACRNIKFKKSKILIKKVFYINICLLHSNYKMSLSRTSSNKTSWVAKQFLFIIFAFPIYCWDFRNSYICFPQECYL